MLRRRELINSTTWKHALVALNKMVAHKSFSHKRNILAPLHCMINRATWKYSTEAFLSMVNH